MTLPEEIVLIIVSIIISALFTLVGVQLKRIQALGRGIQALLRNELYRQHKLCVKKGYATVIDKNNFQNIYAQYHALGKNGVMDVYYKHIMEMPEKPISKRGKHNETKNH